MIFLNYLKDILGVFIVNKKQAIAYAQVTLDYMQSPKYNGELNLENFGIEMKQAFKLYSSDIIVNIADAQIKALKELKYIKIGSDLNE